MPNSECLEQRRGKYCLRQAPRHPTLRLGLGVSVTSRQCHLVHCSSSLVNEDNADTSGMVPEIEKSRPILSTEMLRF